MSGYSQGGQLVHNAAKLLPASTTAKVAAAVIFGDPSTSPPLGFLSGRSPANIMSDKGDAIKGIPASKTKIICHAGDNICDGGILVLPPHLTYGLVSADDAAVFVKKIVG